MKFKGENGSFTYLAEVELGEGRPIQVLPLGRKEHPEYGTIDITPEKCQRFVANFDNRVRGIDVPLNFAHGKDVSKGEKAAGWIKKLEFRPDSGLWAVPDYTNEAEKEVADRAWRYISAEYRDSWTDGQGVAHNDVLMGAALTNKPFMKDMAPVNFEEFDEFDDGTNTPGLSPTDMQAHLRQMHGSNMSLNPHSALYAAHEAASHGPNTHEHMGYGGYAMIGDDDPIALSVTAAVRKKATKDGDAFPDGSYPITNQTQADAAWHLKGHSKTHSEASVVAHIRAMVKKHGLKMPGTKAAEEVSATPIKERLATILKLGEDADEDKVVGRVEKLAEFFMANKPEKDPVKKFEEDYPERAKELADLRRTTATQAADAHIKAWNEAGLPPKLNDEVRALMLGDATIELEEDGKKTSKPISFESIMDSLTKTGFVPMKSEKQDKTTLSDDPQTQLEAEVKKLTDADKDLSYRDARNKVLAENPGLAKAVLRQAPEVEADEA